jgi:polyferredoxin
MDLPALSAFLVSPFNVTADAALLRFFLHPSVTAIVVIGAFVVGSLFVKQLWCRFFCPYGAFLGLFSWASPQKVVRDPDACIHCERCTRGCPAGIVVHTELRILTPECTGCMDCVAVCPVDDCLTVGRRGRKGWSPAWVPALALAALLGAWMLARTSGHWTSRLPAGGFREAYRQAAEAEPFTTGSSRDRVPPPRP